jgi:hypothetical protein
VAKSMTAIENARAQIARRPRFAKGMMESLAQGCAGDTLSNCVCFASRDGRLRALRGEAAGCMLRVGGFERSGKFQTEGREK